MKEQEFFASLLKSNLFMQFFEVANDIIYNKKTITKHEYKANVRKAVAAVRYKMLDLLRNSNITRFIIDELLKFICKFKSVVRPGRSFTRNFLFV